MTNYERQTIIYRALEKVYFDKAYSGLVLNSVLKNVLPSDKAFITKVFYGVIEKDSYLNYVIANLSKTRPKPKIALVMKIGFYQLFFTDQKQYAVVSSTVELCKSIGKKEVAGYVNATLKNYKSVVFPNKSRQIEYLSVFGSVPSWLAKKLIKQYGFDFSLEMLSYPLTSKTHIRHNPYKTSRECLENKIPDAEKSPYGFFVTESEMEKLSPDEYIVQSLSSIYAVMFYLKGTDGGKLLDVCSAPGGKAVLAAKVGNFDVTACDIHAHRTELIKKYARKTGTELTVEQNDATVFRPDWSDSFDVVVCDVPCSGIGVIKSKPDVLLNRQESDISELASIQLKILTTSANYVKKGGKLCYSTCTVLKEENECVIEKFLLENDNFEVDKAEDDGILRLYPHTDNCDGFFVVGLRRKL